MNTSSGAGIIGIKGSPAYTARQARRDRPHTRRRPDYAAQNVRITPFVPAKDIDTR